MPSIRRSLLPACVTVIPRPNPLSILKPDNTPVDINQNRLFFLPAPAASIVRFNSILRRVAASSALSSFLGGGSGFLGGGAGDDERCLSDVTWRALDDREGEGEGEFVASEASPAALRGDLGASVVGGGEDVGSRVCAFLRSPPRRPIFFGGECLAGASLSSGSGSGVALFDGVDCFLAPRRPRRGAFAGVDAFDSTFGLGGGEGEALRSSSSVSVSSPAAFLLVTEGVVRVGRDRVGMGGGEGEGVADGERVGCAFLATTFDFIAGSGTGDLVRRRGDGWMSSSSEAVSVAVDVVEARLCGEARALGGDAFVGLFDTPNAFVAFRFPRPPILDGLACFEGGGPSSSVDSSALVEGFLVLEMDGLLGFKWGGVGCRSNSSSVDSSSLSGFSLFELLGGALS